MQEFIDWLREEREEGRIQYHHHKSGHGASYRECDLNTRIERALESQGINHLYEHQVQAINAIRDGNNVVVATPTASGKSLVYTIPAIERALEDGTRTLYIAPMRALINDQEAALGSFVDDLGFGPRVEHSQYTGQQSQSEKRNIREAEPQIILTTPDMLHLGLLPWSHRLWEWFFGSLDLVVLDEVHEYRGIFGSHVSLLLRRLARVCTRFESAPQYICCSATIGNPVEHAAAVTGEPEDSFALVDEDTSATGPQDWLFWNPPLKSTENYSSRSATKGAKASPGRDPGAGGERRSPHPETARLFCDLVQRGYQTLVFTNSRQNAERYAQRTSQLLTERGERELAENVAAYQAALQQSRRETIEARLQNGDLRGVWSTNALELGIDIGSLDAVLLDGYPGTRMETNQRAGRAGRGTAPSLVALIAGQDQLDQYLMANPAEFFNEPPERAMVNPGNDQLLPKHLLCAARENWLSTMDEERFGDEFSEVLTDLVEAGRLNRREARPGIRWTPADGETPHQDVSLRSIDDKEVRLLDVARDEQIGSLPFSDALRDVHPNAIYYHQGRTYEVVNLEVTEGRFRALLRETNASHYTRPLREKTIHVDEDRDQTTAENHGDLTVWFADITIREQIDGYVRYDGPNEEGTRMVFDTALPETTLRTKALYFTIPPSIQRRIADQSEQEDGFAGAIHAVEHGMISLFPLELLCDRRDIGGLSTPRHPHTEKATIFIHDGHPGGVGLAKGGFNSVDNLLHKTREMVRDCSCESGCPACIQSPHCGNANSPLTKDLAVSLLELLSQREK